jgi:acyl carrier protein
MTENIRERTVGLLLAQMKSQVDPSTIGDERSIEDLGLNSLHLMNLMYELEDAFSVELDPEQMLEVGNVGELILVLKGKIAARAAAAAA